MAPEQELEYADVVSAHAAPDDSSSEEWSAARPESSPGSRSDEAVDSKALTPLEDTDCADRLRALDAVDASSVEPVLAQGDLDTRDLRVHCARRGREGQGCRCGRDC